MKPRHLGSAASIRIAAILLVSLAVSPLVAAPPAQPIRALHAVTANTSGQHLIRLVDMAALHGFNTLVIQLREGLVLEHAPWTPAPNAMSKQEFGRVLAHARLKGFNVVPELKFLTHQEKFFQENQPHLMFNTVTYDPRKEETYEHVTAILEEVIEFMQPDAVHIGHDEVVGWNKAHTRKVLGRNQATLPADLFVRDVLWLHDYLRQRGIDMWMWGDALISPREFPQMLGRHLHGGQDGFGKELRDRLPKDIVICDWHYYDDQVEFPSLATLHDEGFRVIGSTFRKADTVRNFSSYAARHGALGMMATTWFYVPQNKWPEIETIIRNSGQVFMTDFPDARP